jgi:sirohydrochlorin cobaltochelatase
MSSPHPISPRPGLLLVGHGTRDPQGQREFFATVRQVQSLCTAQQVQPCFLELAAPTIEEGVAAAYKAGVRRLTVAPLLLFAAGHARRDIPEAVGQAVAAYDGLQLLGIADALDCHPAVIWLSELRYRQALCGRAPIAPQETALVMIGRGSSDAEAAERMRRFAQLRTERTPVGMLTVGFVAVQQPTLADALQQALASRCRRVVVQPHLLFQGELTDEVRRLAATAAAGRDKELIVTPHLAPGWPLARALIARAAESNGLPSQLVRNA